MRHETEVWVRFCETDAAGHVNNTSYFIYLEEARGKFFEEIQPNRSEVFEGFIIASTKCDFVSQAYFKQRLIISTSISKIGSKSFSFHHAIKAAETNELVATAEATIVCFNYEKQKTEEISSTLREVLEGYLVMN
ncbi:acyl-CoA thioesterase [Thalassobacillus devorans]|uniref:acyl-CoA thioesterase n=1 Tax=Thalassobacillus devorans TaxID=279813 RepID=UPI00048E2E82|nr:thioesterase family protein [Thalassobacillus devorans]